jgi:hypothetical protein
MNVIAFAVLISSLASSAPAPSRVQPVRIGANGQPGLDACPSTGQIASAVAARLAPTGQASVSLTLRAGQSVYLCGSSSDGAWESVVVPAREGQDCGVSRPVSFPRVYAGPCRSGWVPAGSVRVVAGPPNNSSKPTPLRGAA